MRWTNLLEVAGPVLGLIHIHRNRRNRNHRAQLSGGIGSSYLSGSCVQCTGTQTRQPRAAAVLSLDIRDNSITVTQKPSNPFLQSFQTTSYPSNLPNPIQGVIRPVPMDAWLRGCSVLNGDSLIPGNLREVLALPGNRALPGGPTDPCYSWEFYG